MFKTVSTLPYLAALLAANTVGLELVVEDGHDSPQRQDQHHMRSTNTQRARSPLGQRAISHSRNQVGKFSRRMSNAASSLNESISQLGSRRTSIANLQERAWKPLFRQVVPHEVERRSFASSCSNYTCFRNTF